MGDYGKEGKRTVDVLTPARKIPKYKNRAARIDASYFNNGKYSSRIQLTFTWHTHLINGDLISAFYPSAGYDNQTGMNIGDLGFSQGTNTDNHFMISTLWERVQLYNSSSRFLTAETLDSRFDSKNINFGGNLLKPDASLSYDFFFNVQEIGESEFIGPPEPID